jgi:hypothetical protein
MFAVAFPLAPVLAYLNNLWEARLDLLKLKISRRPHAVRTKDLGAWFVGLEVRRTSLRFRCTPVLDRYRCIERRAHPGPRRLVRRTRGEAHRFEIQVHTGFR